MFNSSFIHPLEATQVRSVLSYVVLLSDFLLNENVLNTSDINKPIPAVNAMYKYLVDPNADPPAAINDTRLNKLTKYLIRNSDLYGTEDGEILDPHFIQALFNHIINSLVFNKYGNVYGFIAEEVRISNCTTDKEMRKNLLGKLLKETFKNEDGSVSKLKLRSSIKIYQEYILPLFPKGKNESSIFSIDYIYAQAGSMFFRSLSNATVDHMTRKEFLDNSIYENDQFEEFIRVAHIVEQLVTTRKIDNSALRIFAVPALLQYVHEKKEDLRNKTMASIINNQTEWQTAFQCLFSNLNDFFESVDEVQDKNHKSTFLHALHNYENQSSLARSNLKRNCPTLSDDFMEKEVEEYLKCTKDCFCLNRGKRTNISSVDTLFREQFNSTVQKYATYERASLKNIFPDEIKKLMDNQKVEIRKGLFENYYVADLGPGINNGRGMQAVPEQHDILEFYSPETKQSAYYALIRKDFEVSLINETSDKQFREKLGLYSYTYLVSWKFSIPLKSVHENFNDFLKNIMRERISIFENGLKNYKHEKKKQPWWKEFLLPLIPFYSCAQAINDKDLDLAEMACLLDITLFIPGAAEVSIALRELTAGTSEALARISIASIKVATARLSLRAAIRSGGRLLIKEGHQFIELFTPQLFKKVGIAVLRIVDPGFELLYALGKDGIKSIGKFVVLMENKYHGSFSLMQETLKNAMNRMPSVTERIVENLYLDKKVYYNSLEKNSGYGYKFIYSPERKILPLRTVEEFADKVPVLSLGTDIDQETYAFIYERKTKNIDEVYEIDGVDKIDESDIYEIKPTIVHLVHGSELKLTEREFKIRFKNSPLQCSRRIRFKRSPDEICSRASLRRDRNARVNEAVEFATKNPFKRRKIKDELRKYLFLENSEKKELDFVTDWKNNNFLSVPEWSEKYRIELPEVYNELRYNEKVNEKKSLESLDDVDKYNYYKSRGLKKYVSFPDYKNIYKYVKEHFRFDVNRETEESLYRLAIRQSDDFITEYDKKLYFVEYKLTKSVDTLFLPKGKEFVFNRFTSTTTNDYFAPHYCMQFQSMYQTKVMYEMYFPDTYLRAKTEIFTGDINREETILLPGSKFEITDVIKETRRKGYKTVTVKMTYKHEAKLEDIKRVMKELKKLGDSGA